MIKEDLTHSIISAAYMVSNKLGIGYLEKVYENALRIELAEANLKADSQAPIQILYRGHPIGNYFADILVEETVIVEIKATEGLRPEHIAQLLNYLRATGIEIGLLLNFGKPKMEIRRFNNRFPRTTSR